MILHVSLEIWLFSWHVVLYVLRKCITLWHNFLKEKLEQNQWVAVSHTNSPVVAINTKSRLAVGFGIASSRLPTYRYGAATNRKDSRHSTNWWPRAKPWLHSTCGCVLGPSLPEARRAAALSHLHGKKHVVNATESESGSHPASGHARQRTSSYTSECSFYLNNSLLLLIIVMNTLDVLGTFALVWKGSSHTS